MLFSDSAEATIDPYKKQPPVSKRSDHVLGRIIRVQHGSKAPYTKIANALLTDSDLSFKSLGLLAYLLSKPNDWTVTMAHLATTHSDGLASVKSGIKELKRLGYIKVDRRRDERGRWMFLWIVFETRQASEEASRSGIFDSIVNGLAAAPQSNSDCGGIANAPQSKTDLGMPDESAEVTFRETVQQAHADRACENQPLVSTEDPETESARTDRTSAAAGESFAQEASAQPKIPNQIEFGQANLDAELKLLGICGAAFDELRGFYPLLKGDDVRHHGDAARQRGKGTGAIIADLRQMAIGRRERRSAALLGV